MTILIFIVVALVVVVAGFFIVRTVQSRQVSGGRSSTEIERQPRDPFAPDEGTGGDPRQIRAGDMLSFGGERAFVRGSVHLSEGGYNWSEHFFQTDAEDQRRWLSVEADPDLELSIWQDRTDLEVDPNAQRVEIEGTVYKRIERGTANYRTEGTTGLRASGSIEYVDFESADGRLLGLERVDQGSWEVSTGESVSQHSLTIYPGG